MNTNMPIRYEIRDKNTGQVISSHKTRRAATRKADRLDLKYGAIRYLVRPIWEEKK